jgi:hypothetical protein
MQKVTVKKQAEEEFVLHEINEKKAVKGIVHEEATLVNV